MKLSNFITEIIDRDMVQGKNQSKVHTRFPPEPNGYLHIGHAKSICLNFGIASDYGGLCNFRFDDTNPEKEEKKYVDSIKQDVEWLGFNWGERLFYASDYFERFYEYAVGLIKKRDAYVCDLTAEEIRKQRGSLTEPGKDSPYRGRAIEENLDLFRRMREGEFEDASKVLRAKIDMSNPNLIMRDPVLFRIRRVTHHRTKDKWCIYPMYDFAHCISDSIEGITHSICTLEFENNRPLYDWILEGLGIHHPQQIEFARLNLSHTVLSKRKLLELVEGKYVNGWDDPRMPTISGLRRRGYTPSSIKTFCERIGVAKFNSIVDTVVLENSIREELNKSALRVMAILKPLKAVIVNYPEGEEETEAINNPEDAGMGTRKVPFSRIIYIERDDFCENPPKKFFRLSPGAEVRLKYAYFIKCEEVVRDRQTGEIKEIHCIYDPATRSGNAVSGRKVKGTIHWVSAKHAVPFEARLYDHLFTKRDPNEANGINEGVDYKAKLNPSSMQVLTGCYAEPSLKTTKPGMRYQFERLGYFCADAVDSSEDHLVFNRIVSLRDTWKKISEKTIQNLSHL